MFQVKVNPCSAGNKLTCANRVDPDQRVLEEPSDQRSPLFVIYNYPGEFTQIIHIDWPYLKNWISPF